LDAPTGEERVRRDEDGVGSLAHKHCEGGIDLATGAGVVKLDLQSKSARSRFHVSARGRRRHNVGRIDEHGDASDCRHQLTQEF
jgi:hypothetical protein